jgi:1,2-diacylglycerol 3-alpha-glucosyltransferase
MNIILFTDTYPPEINGVATSTMSLHNVLLAHGHKVLVVTTNPFSNAITYENGILRMPGIEMKKYYGYRAVWPYNSRAFDIINAFKGDIVHIQTDGGVGQFGHIVSRNLRIPSLYTYHTNIEDYTYYVTKGHFDRFAKSIVRVYTKNTLGRVNEFIIPSLKTKDYLRSIGVDSYVNVVPTGLDFSKFSSDKIDQDKLKQEKAKLGIDKSKFTLISLGRVAKEKSIDVCLRGYAIFAKAHPELNSKFLIVGGGPSLEELVVLSKQLHIEENTIFVGAVKQEDVAFYYHLADAFVSASLTETQGLTYMEAMASSLIVLARFDANLTAVIDDNKTGYFFTDEKDMAEKLERTLLMSDEKKKEMLNNAKLKIQAFSIDKFYSNIIEVYQRAIKKSW